jgi:hypothetical protein
MTEMPSLPATVVRAGLSRVAGVGGALAELAAHALERDRSRVTEMTEKARETVGNDEKFVHALRSDPRLVDMLMGAAQAAGQSDWRAKRLTMGLLLGQAILDAGQMDKLATMLSAVTALEPVHFRYLSDLVRSPERSSPAADESTLVPEPYRSHLLAVGVVSVHTHWNGHGPQGAVGLIGVNDFGARLLQLVRALDPAWAL